MQFLVKRCLRNQIILFVGGPLVIVALLWSLVNVLQVLAPQPAQPGPSVEEVAQQRVEHRKQAIASYLAAKYRQHKEVVRSYVDLAWHESEKHPDVPPEMVLAIMTKESSLISTAKSSYGAQGLMQVVRRWHPEKLSKQESLLDPRVNVRVGTQILQQYIKEKGQIEQALAKYSGNAQGYADFVLRQTAVLQAI
jgi:soluble lytic murein transglycosylase-like protein